MKWQCHANLFLKEESDFLSTEGSSMILDKREIIVFIEMHPYVICGLNREQDASDDKGDDINFW